MPIDYGRLKTTLSNSGIQVENNALQQTILGLINGVQSNAEEAQAAIDAINTLLSTLTTINVVEPDTTAAPSNVDVSTIIGMTVVKDVWGMAATNPITIIGTVDGVVNPQITSNYGIFRLYKGITDGEYHQW
jgi:hypothetical protein